MRAGHYTNYFSLSKRPPVSGINLPAIVFVPTNDKWNDFALRTRFSYIVIEIDGSRIEGEIHLGFQDVTESTESASDYVFAKILKTKREIRPAEEFPDFFTMHYDLDAYRQLVERLEPGSAKRLLMAINDLVAVKTGRRHPPWFKKAIASRPFILAFTRNAETFFAFHNAGSILKGLEWETSDGISESLVLHFKLPAFQNSHILEFLFSREPVFPKRIVVVIGKNGVGKSQALSKLTKALLAGGRRVATATGERPLLNRLLAISSPGETRNTFPSPPANPAIPYRRIFLTNRSADQGSNFGDALVRLARSNETVLTRDRWSMFCEAVSTIAPASQLFVKVKGTGTSLRAEFFSLDEMRAGSEQQRLERLARINSRTDVFRKTETKFVPLSSGQSTFMRFAAQASLYIENGTLVLVDEPETHLHPNFITDFKRLLEWLLKETGSFAIIATHSAYLVREVARTQVIVLREGKNRTVEVLRPRLRTFGADIGEISQFVFEDQLFGDLVGQVRERLKGDRQNAKEFLNVLEQELSPEAWMSLNREIVKTGQ